MCGRYALALRPSQIRRMLREDNMPVDEAPDDDVDAGPGGYNGPRQSYNFAPGYRGVVYRADVPDWGAGRGSGRHAAGDAEEDASAQEQGETGEQHGQMKKKGKGKGEKHVQSPGEDEGEDAGENTQTDVHYKLQAMKWGLVPFWTKKNPTYGSVMKTINCRDDSLAQRGGMWSSMKARKRCVVVAQGFYEWLKKDGGKEKMPHFVRRKDGKLMCFAGLWDVVVYEEEGEKHYTYTIITTDSNEQLRFLHDRMPVILENGSDAITTWLDPSRTEWSKELQSLLRPYEGELEVYPVSKDVGKVGNDSPAFIIPIDSKENKSNIANFFGAKKKEPVVKVEEEQPEIRVSGKEGFVVDDGAVKNEKVKEEEKMDMRGIKREADDGGDEPRKKVASSKSPGVESGMKGKAAGKKNISATRNDGKGSAKTTGSQKITRFFANSS